MTDPTTTAGTTAPDERERWAGSGSSTSTDAAAATTEAITAAAGERTPRLVILFCSPSHDMATIARAAADLVPDGTTVVGCTTAGEIVDGDAGSGHVVALAIGGPGFTVATSLGMVSDGDRAAGAAAAACMTDIDAPHQVLLLLSDGLIGPRGEIVRGAYGALGAGVPLVGGCAGDELAMRSTQLLRDGEVLSGAIVGVGIGSTGPIGIGVGHGWRRIGEPVVVTESDGHTVHRLDDQPAFDHYLTSVGAPPEAFERGAGWQNTLLFHPFGLIRPGGEEVRAVLGVDHDTRSLWCGDVPQGTVITMMRGDAETVMAGTHQAADAALAGLGDTPPVALLAFDCAARRAVLGPDGIRSEAAELAARAPGTPIAGFYTYGEYSRTHGARGVHNATLVLLALG